MAWPLTMRACKAGRYRSLVIGMLALTLTSMLPAHAQVWHVDCSGKLKVENLFDGSQPEFRQQSARITVNPEAGYVKRPPELAAGCLEKKVEICGCEQGEDAIRCRSLGVTPDGTEIAMDFILDRRTLRLRAEGRRQHPKSGDMTETSGELVCQAAASP